jgi:hypothetical protein
MKVFAATADRQGERESDFCWTIEGELVTFPVECDADRYGGGIDGGCGCMRAMAGMTSQTATTTFRVVDLEVTMHEFRDLVLGTLQEGGWPVDDDIATKMAEEVADAAAVFTAGPVLERRGDDIQPR